MADVSGGRIVWKLEVDDSEFNAQLAAAETRVKGFSGGISDAGKKGFASFASTASDAFSQVASGLGTVLKYAVVAGVGIAAGLGAAANASFETVRGVQSATLALKAYTGSAESAGRITGELIAFAKSDAGVLFNRKELLFAAQALAGYGASAQNVTGYVKIMSRAVAMGNTTFEELAPILGKIAAQGKITSVDFDMLTGRGIILDKSMRGAAVTFDSLFAAISKAIPASILDEQAKTVESSVIRLKTRFRELGDQLLGTKYGSVLSGLGAEFAAGGLGDAIVTGIKTITAAFASPDVTGAIANFGNQIAGLARNVIPLLTPAIMLISRNLDAFAVAIASVATAFVTLKGIAAGFSIAALFLQAGAAGPILLIAAAIALVVTGLTYFIIQTGKAGEVLAGLKGIVGTVVAFFNEMKPALMSFGQTILSALKVIWDGIKSAVGAVKTALQEAFGNVDWSTVFSNALSMIGSVIAFIAPIIGGAIKVIGDFIATLIEVGSKIWDIVKPVFDFIAPAVMVVWNAIQTMLIPALQYLWEKLQPILPILKWIAIILGVVIVAAIAIFVTAILLVVAVVVAIVAAIAYAVGWLVGAIVDAFNWIVDAIVNAWDWIKQAAIDTWDFIKNTVKAGIDFIKNYIQQGVNNVVNAWNAIKQVPGIVAGAISSAYNAVANFIGRFVEAGKNIIQGILNGLRSAASDVIGFISNLFGDVVSIAKKILHIGSPSRVFHDIGMDTMRGMANGILAGAGVVSRAVESSIPTSFDTGFGINTSVSSSGFDNSSASAQASPTQVNITINPQGIMARSREDVRDIAKDLVGSIDEELRVKNIPTILPEGIGGTSG